MYEVLNASNIRKNFCSGNVIVEALKPASLMITAGTINVIIGRSGSGKSTLLKVLGGLLKPDGGQVLIEKESIYSLSDANRARLRGLSMGFVFQEYNLINELSVIQNVRLPFDINRRPYDYPAEDEIINRLDLKYRLDFYPDQLSGGERQRTAIARALLMKPSLILADEPTGNLDSESAKNLINYVVTSNHQRNQTYAIVTHDLEWIKIADHVFRLSDGYLSAEK